MEDEEENEWINGRSIKEDQNQWKKKKKKKQENGKKWKNLYIAFVRPSVCPLPVMQKMIQWKKKRKQKKEKKRNNLCVALFNGGKRGSRRKKRRARIYVLLCPFVLYQR